MYSFFRICILRLQKVLLWPKKIFFEKYQYGYPKNAEFYADFKFVDADLNKCPRKKLEPKNYANFEYFRFCAFFRGFLLLTFVRCISESRQQQIWNQHKILRFLIPIMIFFKKKNFWVIIALFAILKCKCEKNCAFSNILQQVKSYFFANIYHSPCDSYWNSKKSIKLKPPNVQYQKIGFKKAYSILTYPMHVCFLFLHFSKFWPLTRLLFLFCSITVCDFYMQLEVFITTPSKLAKRITILYYSRVQWFVEEKRESCDGVMMRGKSL